ncbi:hypothetical protein LA080_001997 [Diaporthe eres]|nr:hypothetical protein LA080_001997 [Diaporthe eres]
MCFAQDQVHRQSLEDPESFWAQQAEHVYWHRKPTSVLEKSTKTLKSGVEHPYWTWFDGGKISTCYNCVDRHVLAGNGDCPAIFYDSPVTKTKKVITYGQLLHEVEIFAAVLRDEGVKKGDVVLVYIVFGGFAANALAQRIAAAKPVIILTASCGIEGTKPPIGYRPFIKEAIEISGHRPKRILVWQREQLRWPLDETGGDRDWSKLARKARASGIKANCVPVDSNDAVYIIYTSGTTGSPKGVVRDAGGHAVGLQFSIRYTFGIHGPGDVMFAASDIGWIVGHSYIIYGPLLTGAATVLYEASWNTKQLESVAYYPAALRAIKGDDPENRHLRRIGSAGGLKSLRSLFLGGERSEVSLVAVYQQFLRQYGSPGAIINDNWWSSETGSPISAISLSPEAATNRKISVRDHLPLVNVKPGTAGKLMPGFHIRVVDDQGQELRRGEVGNIVLSTPLPPAGFRSLWDDEERFYKGYLKRFGKWMDTGDTGTIHEDGYVSVLSRSDDVINTAGHRLSTSIIEQAITSHPLVAEASVVGIPDALKGQLPFAFVTLSTPEHPHSAIPNQRLINGIQKRVREQVGGIATLGGIIQGKGIIPKTRSGKTLRRVLKELIENAVHEEFEKDIVWPATIEDVSTVETARGKIAEYFKTKGARHKAIEDRPRL